MAKFYFLLELFNPIIIVISMNHISSYTKIVRGSELSPLLNIPKVWQKQNVEVTVTLIPSSKKRKKIYTGGSLQKYANAKLRKIEKKGIELAMKEKHESN